MVELDPSIQLKDTDSSFEEMLQRWSLSRQSDPSIKVWGILGGIFVWPHDGSVPSVLVFPNAQRLNKCWKNPDPFGFCEAEKLTTNWIAEAKLPYKYAWAVDLREGAFSLDPTYDVALTKLYLLRTDQTGIVLDVFDENTREWLSYGTQAFLPDDPLSIITIDTAAGLLISDEALAQQLYDTGIFKKKTEYLIIGDEPKSPATAVVNLKTMISETDYQNLRKYLTLMPRSILWNFFMTKVWPSLPTEDESSRVEAGLSGLPYRTKPKGMGFLGSLMTTRTTTSIYGDTHTVKPFEELVWAAFIDLFNSANLEYINANQLEPWVWEQKKLDAYYVSQSETAIKDLEAEISAYGNVGLGLDPQAVKIMEAYAQLPRIGDLGLEINRQNAVKELLKKKDYVTAQAVVDAFRYINESDLGVTLTKPIPYDVISEDGTTVVKAT